MSCFLTHFLAHCVPEQTSWGKGVFPKVKPFCHSYVQSISVFEINIRSINFNRFACTHPPSLWTLVVRIPKCLSRIVPRPQSMVSMVSCQGDASPIKPIHDRYRPWNLETGIKAPCSRFESESSWIFYQRTRLSRLFPPFSTPFFGISGDSTSQVFVSHCISLCYESNFINSPKKFPVSRAGREWLVGFGVFDVLDSVIFGPRCAMSLYVTSQWKVPKGSQTTNALRCQRESAAA